MTVDDMVGWHYGLDGHEFEQALGVGGRQGWCAAVHGVARSRTRLSNFTFTFHFPALEKETATHSSVIAWRIPRMGVGCHFLLSAPGSSVHGIFQARVLE